MFYYKLSVYNLTVYDLSNSNGYCYMWDETAASRGPCDIASCVYRYLKDCANKGITEVALYSDNCSGQNRNRFLVTVYMYELTTTNLQTIRHNYLQKGHTQNENDSIHATI